MTLEGLARAACLAGALVTAACGKFGFDPLGDDAIDGGGDTTDSGGDAIDGSGGDAGSTCVAEGPAGDASCTDGIDNDCDLLTDDADPDCAQAAACLTVTTAVDENDSESPAPPHLCTGLSLREAITLANSTAGRDCIVFDGVTTLTPQTNLPALTDPDGVTIDGGGAVILDGSSVTANPRLGLDLAAPGCAVRGMNLRFWTSGVAGVGVTALADDSTIGPDVSVESSSACIVVGGAGSRVIGARASFCTGTGLEIADGASSVLIAQTIIHGNTRGVEVFAADGVTLRHNTIHANSNGGIVLSDNQTGLTIENNALSSNGVAIDATGVSIDLLDYNAYFGNSSECRGCVTGAHAVYANPMYASPPDDMGLLPGSLLIDAARDSGLDVNGDAPGLFDGAAPDIGAVESM